MSFANPQWLVGLLLVPLALAAQLHSRRRAQRYAIRFPALTTLRAAAAGAASWHRHVPVGLLLAGIAALALALARPHITHQVAVDQASIMLVTDHSGSMAATDVQPTRLAAAEQAADTFIGQPAQRGPRRSRGVLERSGCRPGPGGDARGGARDHR